MLLRAKASAVAVAAAIGTLLAPAALASPGVSHASVQVTGKQLKGGLLPPARFQPGYKTIFSSNSGGKLEHSALFHVPSMKCNAFWSFIGTVDGFGDTAFATEEAAAKSAQASVLEIFQQSVYQLASTRAATSLFGQLSAKYKSCRSASTKDTEGGTLKRTVHSRSTPHVGGHKSLLLAEYLSDSKISGPPSVTYALWTLDGTDIYMVSSQVVTVSSPKPTLSSLMLKLIPRIRALK